MRLAVSNIAWSARTEGEVFGLLRGSGIRALEVAPTKLWPDWQGCTESNAMRERVRLRSAGFEVVAMQSVLFAKPHLQLFGDNAQQERLYEHLLLCFDIAVGLGASTIVFGSPQNRLRGDLAPEVALQRAAGFFQSFAERVAETKVVLAIEANPAEYGGDFLLNAVEAARLVGMVSHPSIRLHLDTACMFLGGEDVNSLISRFAPELVHFHASEPYLAEFDGSSVLHAEVARSLAQQSYCGYVSLEMRDWGVEALRRSLSVLTTSYAQIGIANSAA